MQFFMTPVEFEPLICEIARPRGLWIILERIGFGIRREERLQRERLVLAEPPGTLTMPDSAPAERLYLTTDQPELERLDPDRLRPGEWGWVQVDVPAVEGRTLLLADVAAKSDWYDPDERQVYENPASLALFRRIVAPIRRQLKRPVWARNVVYGGASYACGDLGYSDGAAHWEVSGGELKQRAVENVRFSTSPPSSPA